LEEGHLIELLVKGDDQAYRVLIDQYGDLVYNTALSLIQVESDAQDITQDVFIQVFQSISGFQKNSSLKTWIYRITVTKSLDEIKKNKAAKRGSFLTRVFKNKEERTMPDIPHFFHPGIELEQKENAAALFMAIEKLPENQRVAFTLHKVEQLSYKEIADIMNASVSSVESYIFRAKQNLRQYLEGYYKDHP